MIGRENIRVTGKPAGLFYGMQTLRNCYRWRSSRQLSYRLSKSPTIPVLAIAVCCSMSDDTSYGHVPQEIARSDGAIQVQHVSLAPDRRPGLAHRDQEISQAHRIGSGPMSCHGPNFLYTEDGIRTHLLHTGADQGNRGLCQGTLHHGDSRDRNAGTFRSRSGGISRTGVHAGRGLTTSSAQGGNLHVPAQRAQRGRRAFPGSLHPHWRRRSTKDS